MYDTILVPTDGSTDAETATKTALGLAQRFDASLHAINVVELDKFPANVGSEAAEELTQHGEEILATLRNQATDVGISATTHVIEIADSIHQAIIDYAEDHDVDLIVMGTQGRTGLNRLVLGSVAERTLRTSPVPLLTVHGDTTLDPNFEAVLVPTDGSDAANVAADHGITLAEATDAAMHVVHVVDLTAASGEFGSAEVLDALEKAGQQAVDDVIDRADEAELRSVEASIVGGSPAQGILDYAEERDIDLIVMGTHGRTGLERYLLGSVTEKIVRVADVPVLTVSPPEDY
ncbi:universal stress protein [Halorussus amylolyticus]|uniref:universal stress protein n=1 Tax=Halorussus amylolyticus TaxID=1126242 RepID=UPI001052DC35|nr:universal stress protein [Halorussus amylolyticus]